MDGTYSRSPSSKQRVVAITGGASGIGGAASRKFADLGDHVILLDIAEDAANHTAHEIQTDGGEVTVVVADITTEKGVESLFDAVVSVGAGLDVLVNNVGDFRPTRRTFLRTEPTQWEEMHRKNFWHVLAVTHRLAPFMVTQGQGAIINVSTVEAFRGIPSNSVYSGYNAAISAFTKSLAVELGPEGIRVNAIAPDLINTPQTPVEAMLGERDPQKVQSWIPLGRFGEADDVADVISFLASNEARFLTGQTLPVDGGTLAASGWYKRQGEAIWTNMPNDV